VGIAWEVLKGPDDLALDRLGSMRIECFFGHQRMMMRGQTSWDRPRNKGIDTAMKVLLSERWRLKCPLRRYRTEAGCTLSRGGPPIDN
jgi:hypothetical protein